MSVSTEPGSGADYVANSPLAEVHAVGVILGALNGLSLAGARRVLIYAWDWLDSRQKRELEAKEKTHHAR
jgi:hypothetical protein